MCVWLIPSVIIQMLLQISVSLAEYLCSSRQSWRVRVFFPPPLSVTSFTFLQKLVLIFQEWSGQGRWGEISRTPVTSGSCFGSPLRHGCPYSLPILGSCGILLKKMNAAQPFCAYHKDVSNLQKLSRNDKTFPRCLCWFKHFLYPDCSGLYTGWLLIAAFSNITQM